jgi:FkbM family methyltransferase
MHLRREDSDFDCVRYIFCEEPFSLAGFPEVDARIDARYDAIRASGKVPLILDAGANIGASPLWFARRYPAARIIAVEPDPGNVAMLRRNCGHDSRIVIVDAAIGSRPGRVSLSQDESWSIRAERSDSGIPVVTVDQAVQSVDNGELLLAKINIEGFESDLFAENLDWLSRVYVVMIEPHDRLKPGNFTSRNLQRAMAKEDFELFIRDDFLIYVRD